jgi:hypothetical protein
MTRNQAFTLLFTLSMFFLSCDSNLENGSKDDSIFGVYQADWMALRYYLYPDSTFYKVSGKTTISNSEFDGYSSNTTYSLVNPDASGTYTVLKEGENRILKLNYKKYLGYDWTLSSRHKIETNQSFFSINEVQGIETFNKVGGLNELLVK